MSGDEIPATVWAIHDQVITADRTGFSEHYTIGIAGTRDPDDEAFHQGPERLRMFQGSVYPEARLRAWGWEPAGEWTTIITRTRPPVETRLFGVVMPHRSIVPVRRITDDAAAEAED